MRELLYKFDFTAPNVDDQVLILIAVLWAMVVICTLTSIFGRPFKTRTKLFWSLVVIALPLVGVLAYLPFSLKEDLFPYFGFWQRPKG